MLSSRGVESARYHDRGIAVARQVEIPEIARQLHVAHILEVVMNSEESSDQKLHA